MKVWFSVLLAVALAGCSDEVVPPQPKPSLESPLAFSPRPDGLTLRVGASEGFIVPFEAAAYPDGPAGGSASFGFQLSASPDDPGGGAFVVQVHEVNQTEGKFSSILLDGNGHGVSMSVPTTRDGPVSFALVVVSGSSIPRNVTFYTQSGSALRSDPPIRASGAHLAAILTAASGASDPLAVNVEVQDSRTPGLVGTRAGAYEVRTNASPSAGWWYGCVQYRPGGDSRWTFERSGAAREEGRIVSPSALARHWSGEAPAGATARLAFDSTGFANDTALISGEAITLVVVVIAPPDSGWPVELAQDRRELQPC